MSQGTHKPNHIDYIEFPARDAAELARTKAFFTAVFSWTYKDWAPVFADTESSGVTSGINADAEQQHGAPLPVVYTDDLEAARKRVTAAGGAITRDIFDFPGGRRFHFREPAGTELAVWSDRPAS